MTVRIYNSTDASAPTLTGQVGSLIALLDAVLVNGYGAKAAAGWSKPFANASNKGCWLQNLTGSNNVSGMCLYVVDDATAGGGAKEVRACGFETLTALGVGTGQFPTSGQAGSITGGFVNWRKSATADATARAWTIIANGQSFYLWIETGDWTNPLVSSTHFFGDFKSLKSGDQYAVMIAGRWGENTPNAANSEEFAALSDAAGNALGQSLVGHYCARRHTGIGGSVRVGKTIEKSKAINLTGNFYTGESATTGTFSSLFIGRYNIGWNWQFPNAPDGALYLSPVYICHEGVLRGYLPGFWAPLHDRPFGHRDTFTIGSGPLSGKSMIANRMICCVTANNDDACGLFEYSDTWT